MDNALFQASEGPPLTNAWALQAFLLGVVSLALARVVRIVYWSAKEYRVRNAVNHFLTSSSNNQLNPRHGTDELKLSGRYHF